MKKLEDLLKNYQEKGYILILIVDQLNYVKSNTRNLLDNLLLLSWDIFFGSQSANNGQTDGKDWKYHFDSFLFSEEEIYQLIRLHKKIELSQENVKRLMRFTGKVPGEIIRVLDSEGPF